jgi:hypothetical protein
MISAEQFEKARQFIYRHGDLLTRKRFAYHFEDGDRQGVLGVLACYQNADGGFGNGLELDVMCPASTAICSEMGLGYLSELRVTDAPMVDRVVEWVRANRTPEGDLPHPAGAVKAYPHGNWWEHDSGRILSIAGLLGKMGRVEPEINDRAAAIFQASPQASGLREFAVYSYAVALYLWYADGAARFSEASEQLPAAVLAMLEKDAWHHPLFFCHGRWNGPDIPEAVWRSKAERAAATLQDDGGVAIERYATLPWWRPVWTLDMLATMKERGLLGCSQDGHSCRTNRSRFTPST